jgi:uncharacterized membrane protein YeiH
MKPAPFPRVREIVVLTITASLGLAAALAVGTGKVSAWTAAVLTAVFVGLAGIRRSQ